MGTGGRFLFLLWGRRLNLWFCPFRFCDFERNRERSVGARGQKGIEIFSEIVEQVLLHENVGHFEEKFSLVLLRGLNRGDPVLKFGGRAALLHRFDKIAPSFFRCARQHRGPLSCARISSLIVGVLTNGRTFRRNCRLQNGFAKPILQATLPPEGLRLVTPPHSRLQTRAPHLLSRIGAPFQRDSRGVGLFASI